MKIHHISSVVKHAQENLDFYTNVMDFTLLLKTLNYEDELGYHLYYQATSPATFFPKSDSKEGVIGDGQVGYVTYAIKEGSMQTWKERLDKYKIDYFTYERFNETYLAFQDPHGIEIELIEVKNTKNTTIHNATLFSNNPEETVSFFKDIFKFEIIDQDEEILRLQSDDQLIDIRKKKSSPGTKGHGTVDHIAFEVADDSLLAWQEKIEKYGLKTGSIKDRKYFKSIYFKEHGGITLELATKAQLNEPSEDLIIPDHFKDQEKAILDRMMPLFVQKLETLKSYSYRNKKEYNIISKRNAIREKMKTANGTELDLLKKEYLSIR